VNMTAQKNDNGATAPRRSGGLTRSLRFGLALGFAIVALGAGATQALAYGTPLSCTGRSEAPVFARWGDTANYFRVSNGGFESGSTSWALTSGASVVSGNESFYVGASSDSHSLRIGPNGSAESRAMCVSQGEDTLRLFVANSRVWGSILHIDAIATNPANGWVGTAAFDVNGDAYSYGWSPTIALKIPNLFNGNPTATENLTLKFTLRGTPATWGVDDVYIDPFKSW
jgi:hypothetical protein